MTTEQGLKMCAEFMGAKRIDNGFEFIDPPTILDRKRIWHNDDLAYNNSFDWLIPVIKKFSEVKLNDSEPFFKQTRLHKKLLDAMQPSANGYSIEKTFSAVCAGLEWLESLK